LDCDFDVYNEVIFPHPPSFGSFGPPDFDMLCSHISNVSLDVHEDKIMDGVGVPQKTYDIIYDDYVWESTSEQESAMKVNYFPCAPLPHYPGIFLGQLYE